MSKDNNFFTKLIYLTKSSKLKLIYISLLYVISSSLDLLSLGVVGSYVAYILNPSLIDNIYLSFLLDYWKNIILIEDSVASTGILLILLFLLKTIIAIYLQKEIISFSYLAQRSLRRNLMTAYTKIPFIKLVRRDSSEFTASMGNYIKNYGMALTSTLQFIGNIFTTLTIISFLFYINGMLILLMSAGVIVLIFLYKHYFVNSLKLYGLNLTEGYRKLYQTINEFFSGFKELKILNSFKFFTNLIDKNSLIIAQSDIKEQMILVSPRYVIELVVVIFIVGIVFYSQITNLSIIEFLPVLSIFAIASLRLGPIAYQLLRHFGVMNYSEASINKIFEDYNFINSYSSENLNENNSSNYEFEEFRDLSFKSVDFGYENDVFLKDINLNIKKNESVAIIGKSGSGKTTIINLILGLMNPLSGEILFNQKNIQSHLNDWRRQIAYLPQEVFLINNTILSNVALGVEAENINEDKVINSLKKAKLYDFVNSLKNGLDSIVGERGISISGGQRQRIAIARAFYFDRDILIFDEPTSSIDQITEKEIIDYLNNFKKNKTIIIVSHNTEVTSFCDKIYKIDNKIIRDIRK